ncbi:MAG: 3-phosphoshikimate 1-carboxyvinyltransferase [Clostridia bacterium]|nr:3-phosphoshikimate 1-carboxyvinyltransferase [Clostridia bacterium]
MNVSITPSQLKGTLNAIASKSYAHRIIIAAALGDKPVKINLNTTSKDIEATLSCIKALGSEVDCQKEFIVVSPMKHSRKNILLDCIESGSTARFMLPVAAVVCDKFSMTGSGRLPERPFTPLISQMRKNGVQIDSDTLPLSVSGKLHGGNFEIAGNISSQYITGLLMALPLCGEESDITLTSKLQSSAYVNITLEVLKQFGISVKNTSYGYKVKPQKYISPNEITVEGDWSNAAFWIVAEKICGDIKVNGLNYKSLQGDMNILTAIEQTETDAGEIPDLVPILAVMACAKKGATRIYNAERLRLKESDRLKTTAKMLSDLGADIKETSDGLIIQGTGKLRGGKCDGFNDHRIVMSAAIASCLCENDVIITGAEAVNKSYPTFFEDFASLGGKVKNIGSI